MPRALSDSHLASSPGMTPLASALWPLPPPAGGGGGGGGFETGVGSDAEATSSLLPSATVDGGGLDKKAWIIVRKILHKNKPEISVCSPRPRGGNPVPQRRAVFVAGSRRRQEVILKRKIHRLRQI